MLGFVSVKVYSYFTQIGCGLLRKSMYLAHSLGHGQIPMWLWYLVWISCHRVVGKLLSVILICKSQAASRGSWLLSAQALFFKKRPMISFKQPSAQFTGNVHYGNELCAWVHDCEMLKSEQITGNRPRTLWNVKTIIPLVWMVLFSGASLSCALQESRETVKFNNSVMEGKQLIE